METALPFDPERLELAAGYDCIQRAFGYPQRARHVLDTHERFQGRMPTEEPLVLRLDDLGDLPAEVGAEGFDLCGQVGHGVVRDLCAVPTNDKSIPWVRPCGDALCRLWLLAKGSGWLKSSAVMHGRRGNLRRRAAKSKDNAASNLVFFLSCSGFSCPVFVFFVLRRKSAPNQIEDETPGTLEAEVVIRQVVGVQHRLSESMHAAPDDVARVFTIRSKLGL